MDVPFSDAFAQSLATNTWLPNRRSSLRPLEAAEAVLQGESGARVWGASAQDTTSAEEARRSCGSSCRRSTVSSFWGTCCGVGLRVPPEKARKGYEHWNAELVPTVAFSEVDEKIALFELGAYDDPRGAEHVEEEPISRQARGGPDEQEHEQV